MNSARKFIGEAAHCLNLAGELRKSGHEALLVVRRGFELEARAIRENVPCVSLWMQGSFNPLTDGNDVVALRQYVTKFQPDIIHCHRGKDHWLAAVASLLGACPPLVRTRHVVVPMQQHLFNRWLFLRATSRVIAVSEKAAASLGALRAKLGTRLTVIHSAVNSERFHPIRRSMEWRRKRGIADDAPLVGLIGRIQRIKGQLVFIEAAAEVTRAYPKARFLIAGAGHEAKVNVLRDHAVKFGVLDKFVFEGWLEDIETAIASLDVGVVASLGSEGSSRVTLEYMASGVPVVATSVGGIPDIVANGTTGLMAPPGNAQALADAINSYLANPALARGIAAEALDRARTYHSLNRWIGDVLDVFNDAAGNNSASPENTQ